MTDHYIMSISPLGKHGKLVSWKIPEDVMDDIEPYLPEKVKKWKRLQSHIPKTATTDCVINSLAFLDVIKDRDFAEQWANWANTNPQKGITTDELLQLVSDYFTISKKLKITTLIQPPKYSIIDELNNNEYTLALGRRTNGMGHAVVIIKKNGVLSVFDPQQEIVHCGLPEIDEWYTSSNFSHIEYLYYGMERKQARLRDTTSNNSPTKKKIKLVHFAVGKKSNSNKTTKRKRNIRKRKINKQMTAKVDDLIKRMETMNIL